MPSYPTHTIPTSEFENEANLTLANCVDIIKLGDYFLVEGMVSHASQLLWKRLSAILKITAQSTSGPPAVYRMRNPYEDTIITDSTLLEGGFASHFTEAVQSAYGGDAPPGNIAQKILADFVWAARVVLIGNPAIEALNSEIPAFGSHVFTVLNKGPQSGFLPSWKNSSGNMPASAGVAAGAAQGVAEDGPGCNKCTGCNRNWRWDKVPTYIDPTSMELKATRAYCRGCVQDKERRHKEWNPWPSVISHK